MEKSYQTNKKCKCCAPCLDVRKRSFKNSKGYALILIIALLSGLALTAVVILTSSVKIMKINENKIDAGRIYVVRDALRTYYSGHGDLPNPVDVTKVPVEALGLDQKYRIDSHGQYYYYQFNIIDVDPLAPIVTADRTGITKLNVNGQDVAGVLIGFGPNQVQETIGSGSLPVTGPVTGTTIFTTDGDDIVVPVNVTDIAITNCMDELHLLARKICAYGKANYSMPPPPPPDFDINFIIDHFSLSEELQKDPWFNDYVVDVSGDWSIQSWGPDDPDVVGDEDAGNNLIVSIDAENCRPGSSLGTPHIISTLQQLSNIGILPLYRMNDYYKVINDIPIPNPIPPMTSNFTPIGGDPAGINPPVAFIGNFDGNGYNISNITINNSDTDIGLFALVEGVIKNVRLTDVTLTGASDVGAIAGSSSGTIKNCSSTGAVTAIHNDGVAGGLVGTNSGTIEDSYSTATITGGNNGIAGGLVGSHRDASSKIESCYAAGTVSDSNDKGGLVGLVSNGALPDSIIHCYYNSDIFTDLDPNGTPLSTVAMHDQVNYQVNFTGFDFAAITGAWRPPTATEYPRLLIEKEYP